MALFGKAKHKQVTSISINVSGKDENGYSISVSDYRIQNLADAHRFIEGVKVMWNLPDEPYPLEDEEGAPDA